MLDKDNPVNVEGEGQPCWTLVYFSTERGRNLQTTSLPWLHCHTIGWPAGFLFKKKNATVSVAHRFSLCRILKSLEIYQKPTFKNTPSHLRWFKGWVHFALIRAQLTAEGEASRRKAHWLFDHDLEAVSEKSGFLFIRQPNEFLSGRRDKAEGMGDGLATYFWLFLKFWAHSNVHAKARDRHGDERPTWRISLKLLLASLAT